MLEPAHCASGLTARTAHPSDRQSYARYLSSCPTIATPYARATSLPSAALRSIGAVAQLVQGWMRVGSTNFVAQRMITATSSGLSIASRRSALSERRGGCAGRSASPTLTLPALCAESHPVPLCGRGAYLRLSHRAAGSRSHRHFGEALPLAAGPRLSAAAIDFHRRLEGGGIVQRAREHERHAGHHAHVCGDARAAVRAEAAIDRLPGIALALVRSSARLAR